MTPHEFKSRCASNGLRAEVKMHPHYAINTGEGGKVYQLSVEVKNDDDTLEYSCETHLYMKELRSAMAGIWESCLEFFDVLP
jgi:hypothetical protein